MQKLWSRKNIAINSQNRRPDPRFPIFLAGWKLHLSLIGLILIGFFGNNCRPKEIPFIKDKLKKWDEFTTKETEEAIKKNPVMQEVDDLCKQIPLSESFRFYSKRMSSHSLAVFFFYYSEDDFGKSDAIFKDYFRGDGWQSNDRNSLNKVSEYRKGSYLVTIQYGGIGENANYAISCEKVLPAE